MTSDDVDLANAVAALNERVTDLELGVTAPAAGETVSQAQVPFTEWVAWFRETFMAREITDAWPEIPGVAQELQALHAAWCSTHDGDGNPQSGSEAIVWHDHRMRCLDRIEDLYSRHTRQTMLT